LYQAELHSGCAGYIALAGPARKRRRQGAALVSALDAEIDHVEQRALLHAVGGDAQRIAGDGAVVPGARPGVAQGRVPLPQRGGVGEIGLALLQTFERVAPEAALLLAAAPVGEHDGQRDLALAEIVADRLAELGLARRVVEHVIDQLEGDAEVEAIALERLLLDLGPIGDDRTDAAGGGEEGRGLAA